MFGSDCFEGFCREGLSDVHGPVACGCRERTCAESVTEWEQLKCDWPNGDKSRVARRVPGCVVRVAIGGVGGRRILGMPPKPAQQTARSDMVPDHRNARGLPIEFAGANGDAGDRLAQRAKPPSGGGEVKVYSASRGARVRMSGLMSLRGARKKNESASVSAGVANRKKYEQKLVESRTLPRRRAVVSAYSSFGSAWYSSSTTPVVSDAPWDFFYSRFFVSGRGNGRIALRSCQDGCVLNFPGRSLGVVANKRVEFPRQPVKNKGVTDSGCVIICGLCRTSPHLNQWSARAESVLFRVRPVWVFVITSHCPSFRGPVRVSFVKRKRGNVDPECASACSRGLQVHCSLGWSTFEVATFLALSGQICPGIILLIVGPRRRPYRCFATEAI